MTYSIDDLIRTNTNALIAAREAYEKSPTGINESRVAGYEWILRYLEDNLTRTPRKV